MVQEGNKGLERAGNLLMVTQHITPDSHPGFLHLQVTLATFSLAVGGRRPRCQRKLDSGKLWRIP